jgi:hypothetical protein
MAESSPQIHFEDIPLEEARRMRRGPRMDPVLFHALQGKIQIPPDLVVKSQAIDIAEIILS